MQVLFSQSGLIWQKILNLFVNKNVSYMLNNLNLKKKKILIFEILASIFAE